MPKLKLTDGKGGSIFKRPPPNETLELYDTVLPGFGLRIAKKAATYFVITRVRGEPAQLRRRLGTTKNVTLTEARKAARRVIEDAQAGIHPDQAQREAEAAALSAVLHATNVGESTFKAVADRYLADTLRGGGANLRSRGELERKLKVDLKAWHERPTSEITKAEIKKLVWAKAQDHGAAANRLLSFIKRVFAWAAAQDIIEADPTAGITKPAEEDHRERFLDEREIRLFWKACDKLGDPAGRLFKLALVTGQRRGEVAGLRRSELGRLKYNAKDPATGREKPVDGEAWLLPPHRTKRGAAHTVPLSGLAVRLIEGAPILKDGDAEFDHVFATGRRGDQPLSGWSKYRAQLDQAIGKLMAEEAGEEFDPKRHALADWHIHDLRATAATHLSMPPLDVPARVVSRILNHAEGDGSRSMTNRYLRHTWDKEAADALGAWAAKLERTVGENVVELERRGT